MRSGQACLGRKIQWLTTLRFYVLRHLIPLSDLKKTNCIYRKNTPETRKMDRPAYLRVAIAHRSHGCLIRKSMTLRKTDVGRQFCHGIFTAFLYNSRYPAVYWRDCYCILARCRPGKKCWQRKPMNSSSPSQVHIKDGRRAKMSSTSIIAISPPVARVQRPWWHTLLTFYR